MRIFILLLIAYQIINCGEKSKSDEFPDLIFRSDKSLVTQMIAFDKISLFIHSELKKIVGDQYLKIEKNIETLDSSYFKTDVLSIYQSLDGMVFIISKIIDEKSIYNSLDKEFELGLTKSFGAKETKKGQFLINGVETVQFISSKGKIINYKLYIDVMKKKCYQIDYFVPLENFVNLQSLMEASISTIKIIN